MSTKTTSNEVAKGILKAYGILILIAIAMGILLCICGIILTSGALAGLSTFKLVTPTPFR